MHRVSLGTEFSRSEWIIFVDDVIVLAGGLATERSGAGPVIAQIANRLSGASVRIGLNGGDEVADFLSRSARSP